MSKRQKISFDRKGNNFINNNSLLWHELRIPWRLINNEQYMTYFLDFGQNV